MFISAEPFYAAHFRTPGQAWIRLGEFATTRLAPNDWLRNRRFRHTIERWGMR
jgi:hypothetical protein